MVTGSHDSEGYWDLKEFKKFKTIKNSSTVSLLIDINVLHNSDAETPFSNEQRSP